MPKKSGPVGRYAAHRVACYTGHAWIRTPPTTTYAFSMPRVTHFEIHAGDPERAIAFYANVFGWHFEKWDGPQDFWFITTGPADEPGINGGLLPRRGEIDGTAILAYICTIQVASVDEALAAVNEHGGALAVEKMPVPEGGWLAYAKDPEGNVFGLMERSTSS